MFFFSFETFSCMQILSLIAIQKGFVKHFLAVRKPFVKQSCWKFTSRFVFGFRNFFSFLSTEIDRNFAFVAPADSKPKQKSFELVQQKICLQILYLIPLQRYWKSQNSWIFNFGGLSASQLLSNHAENLQVNFFWHLETFFFSCPLKLTAI